MTPIIINGKICEIVGSAVDVTAYKLLQKKLTDQANKDFLTGLANRHYLYKYLSDLTQNDKAFGIVFIDLNDFKEINDSYGHATGDELLIAISKRLKALDIDVLFISRLGGDEFAAIIPFSKQNTYQSVMRLIKGIFSKPFMIQGNHLEVDDAIGCAKYPEDGKVFETLLSSADQAMYENKNTMKNNG